MPVLRNPLVAIREAGESTNKTRKITKKIDILDQKVNSLYRDIYVSRPDNRRNMDLVFDRIDDAINSVQDTDISISGMTELLRRIDDGKAGDKLVSSVRSLFEDDNLMNLLVANQEINRQIIAQNYQYDMVCRYLPKVLNALEIKRDNVLSSDNFEKQFINPKSNRTNKTAIEKFSTNASKLETEYNVSEFLEETYMRTSKYGEDFIYIVPYPVALSRVIKRTNQRRTKGLGSANGFAFYESGNYQRAPILKKSYTELTSYKALSEAVNVEISSEFKGENITLYFNDTNVISTPIQETLILTECADLERFRSLSSIHEAGDITGSLSKQLDMVKDANDKLSAAASSDGLIIPGELVEKDTDKIDKKMLGAVLERIPRENIVPIYIGKKCLGYYYLEFSDNDGKCGFCGSHHNTPGVSNAAGFAKEISEDQQEMAIRFIASRISQAIDSHFINANKDLKEEIYNVLRYNEKFDISRSNDIGVTFIPADDIIHTYFRLDEKTHRGISDLEKGIVPAMLYILLYLTDIISKITRSTDKRIYYVKQNVETNVARTMMNVVQQIKKGNMGMRQIESMNNILNIVGKYNDYIIPTGQSGDPPINFEIMNGQNIETPSEIMEKMLEEAVNSTGVPYEMVNATYQQDFAIRFSMSNTRFLKSIYTRQRDTEKFFAKIFTRLYNYEFDERYALIEIILPPPIYLLLSNNQQLIDSVSMQADKIIENEYPDDPDELKAEFKKIYVRDTLSTYLNFAQIERHHNAAKVNLELKKEVKTGGDDAGGDDDLEGL